MNTLDTPSIATILDTLHHQAEASDRQHVEEMMALIEAPGATLDGVVAGLLARERADYRSVARGTLANFLAVPPAFGRFLYAMVRASKARRIVEFGTSMGVSTIYLAAALRDNGGGQLIGSEIEPAKAAQARANLAAAGLADLVEIREGDALETLREVGGCVDVLLLDGALSLYLPVLKLLEPGLNPGAVILGENAFDPEYLGYVRDPANGYLSQSLPIAEGRGNEFSVRLR